LSLLELLPLFSTSVDRGSISERFVEPGKPASRATGGGVRQFVGAEALRLARSGGGALDEGEGSKGEARKTRGATVEAGMKIVRDLDIDIGCRVKNR
jgi:hypothetical protein